MDNFTIWVDAPSEALIETPLVDESSCFLRDEILQTQQYVIEKLDEQKATEQEKGEQSEEEAAQARELTSLIITEGQRSKDIFWKLTDLKKACKSNELGLASIKITDEFPNSNKLSNGNHEKFLFEMNRELSTFHDQYVSRENILRKLQQNGLNGADEEAKRECKNLRNSVLEAKKKHEKLAMLQNSISKMQAEYDQALTRQKEERESIEMGKTALKAEQELVEQMMDECVNHRSQLVQLEATRSQSQNQTDQNKVERLQANAKQIRQETSELISNIDGIKKDTEVARKKLEDYNREEIENQNLIKERREDIVIILRRKIEEEKKKSGRGAEQKRIANLKRAISRETGALEKARKELEELQPASKNIADLRKEISAIKSDMRGYDKQIKEATKENEKLIEKIMKMRGPSADSTPPIGDFNDTAEFIDSVYSDQIVIPQPSIAVTPTHRPVSHDVFTGAPLMTSTPLQKKTETTVITRAAARRLDKAAAVKTDEIRKKRGGKK